MNQNQRHELAVTLTTLPKLHSSLLCILIYCVLTHTDGFTYSARGLAKLMGIPRRTIQDQVPELVRLKVWTLKEKHQTQNGRELFLYDFHPEAIQTMIETTGRKSPNHWAKSALYKNNNNVHKVPDINKENVQVQGTTGRNPPNDFGSFFNDFWEPNPIYKHIGKQPVLKKPRHASSPALVSDDPLFKDPVMIDRMMND